MATAGRWHAFHHRPNDDNTVRPKQAEAVRLHVSLARGDLNLAADELLAVLLVQLVETLEICLVALEVGDDQELDSVAAVLQHVDEPEVALARNRAAVNLQR